MTFLIIRHACVASSVVGALLLIYPASPHANRPADVAMAMLAPTVHPPVARDASRL